MQVSRQGGADGQLKSAAILLDQFTSLSDNTPL